MAIGKAFTYVFDDPDWIKKVLLAGLVMLIPVIGQIVIFGWVLEILRRVYNNHPQPLPEWDNFGEYLMNGLKVFVVEFVYALPIALLVACPMTLIGIVAGVSGDEETAAALSAIIPLCVMCLVTPIALLIALMRPAIYGKLALTGELSSAFKIGEIFGMVRANPSIFLLALLGAILAGVISGLGTIACVIGVVFTNAYAAAIQGHLYAQAYRAGELPYR
jgi:hypothetical protein